MALMYRARRVVEYMVREEPWRSFVVNSNVVFRLHCNLYRHRHVEQALCDTFDGVDPLVRELPADAYVQQQANFMYNAVHLARETDAAKLNAKALAFVCAANPARGCGAVLRAAVERVLAFEEKRCPAFWTVVDSAIAMFDGP